MIKNNTLINTVKYVGLSLTAVAFSVQAAQKSHVYTETNEVINKIIHFSRNSDGTLNEVGKINTGGKGTDGFKPSTGDASAPDTLLSAGAVAISADQKMLFAVNAGDNSVSSFTLDSNGKPRLVERRLTGERGVPSSLTYNDKTKMLYVLHTKGPNHIRSFKVKSGHLTDSGAKYTVNTNNATNRIPTQIISSPDGRFVLVDVLFDAPPTQGKNGPNLTPSNAGNADGLIVFRVNEDGSLGKAQFNDAGGPTPFSLSFLHGSNDTFVNTLAAGNGVVLSKLANDGTVTSSPIALVDISSAPKGPSETCWVSISPDNKHAFATNFGLGTLSSFNIRGDMITTANGSLGKVKGDGKFKAIAGIPTSGPNDSWVSKDGYLYQLYPNASKLIAYKINGKELTEVGSYGIPYNSTVGLTGY